MKQMMLNVKIITLVYRMEQVVIRAPNYGPSERTAGRRDACSTSDVQLGLVLSKFWSIQGKHQSARGIN